MWAGLTKAQLIILGLFIGTGLAVLVVNSVFSSNQPTAARSSKLIYPDGEAPVTVQASTSAIPQATATAKPHFNYTPLTTLTWTFDDCELKPGQGIVASFISILRQHQLPRAIFFMTGDCYYGRPDLVKLIQGSGYIIGNHTKDHDDLTKLSASQIDAELRGGPPGAKYFRPPYGAHNSLVDSRVKAAGLTMLVWGASGGDSGVEGMRRSCDRILEDLIHTADPGDVVLLHMYNPASPQAMQAYLSGKPNCEE